MDRSFISGWIRQARHKAKQKNIPNDLPLETIEKIVEEYEGKCAYCGQIAESLDHPFPIKQEGPNIGANLVPICGECKKKKKTEDILKFVQDKSRRNKILQRLLDRDHSHILKDYIKKMTGLE